ncbi:hypothetical protein JG688_00004892 [Phytophthora aleatoria]|uniref:Uncharacterized protein n=1 Tax=Phytophthora aleatoria TaxID=2496075 RepID=A0A8J5MHV2_9STRA|nr:hypothetical protein JG688_00004892 [Phytophthora aleatoria]
MVSPRRGTVQPLFVPHSWPGDWSSPQAMNEARKRRCWPHRSLVPPRPSPTQRSPWYCSPLHCYSRLIQLEVRPRLLQLDVGHGLRCRPQRSFSARPGQLARTAMPPSPASLSQRTSQHAPRLAILRPPSSVPPIRTFLRHWCSPLALAAHRARPSTPPSHPPRPSTRRLQTPHSSPSRFLFRPSALVLLVSQPFVLDHHTLRPQLLRVSRLAPDAVSPLPRPTLVSRCWSCWLTPLLQLLAVSRLGLTVGALTWVVT